MSIIHLSQNAFNSGELSPELRRRVDIQKFFSGASQLTNIYCRAQGGARNREGFKYITDIGNMSTDDSLVNIIAFEYSLDINYLLEFTVGQMRVYKNGTLVLKNSSPYVLTSELITADVIRNLYPCQIGNLCFIAYSKGQPLLLTRKSDSEWELKKYENKNGPVGGQKKVGILAGLDSSTPVVCGSDYIFKSSDIGETVRCKSSIGAQGYTSNSLDAGDPSTVSSFNEYWKQNYWYCGGGLSFFTKGTWAGSIALLYSEDCIRWSVFAKFESPDMTQSRNWDWTGSLSNNPGYVRLYIYSLDQSGEGGLRVMMNADPFTWYFDSKIKKLLPENIEQSVMAQLEPTENVFNKMPAITDVADSIKVDNVSQTLSNFQSDTGYTTLSAYSSRSIDITLDSNVNSITLFTDLYLSAAPKVSGTKVTIQILVINTVSGVDIEVSSKEFEIDPVADNMIGAANKKKFMVTGVGDCTSVQILLPTYLTDDDSYVQWNISNLKTYGTDSEQNNTRVSFYVGEWVKNPPNSVTLFQDRLCWGANSVIDTTKTGDYYDFGISATSVDTDAVSTTVKDVKKANIVALAGGKELVGFTDNSEFIFKHEVFGPKDFVLSRESYNGARKIPPIFRDNNIFYVSKNNTLLNMMYDFSRDGYVSDDLGLFSSHLFESSQIVDIEYLKRYNNLFCVLTDNGYINALTFLPEEKVTAWSKWVISGFKIIKIAVVQESDSDKLYAVGVDSNHNYKMFVLSDRNENIFVDNAVVFKNDTPQTTFNVPNLGPNKNIAVFADNNVYYVSTDSSSNFVLPVACSNVVAGLSYPVVLETLPVNFVMNGAETTQMNLKRVIACRIFYTKSRGGFIQHTGGEEEEFVQATQSSVGSSIGLQNGSYEVPLSGVHDVETTITITQKDPLPIHITNLVLLVEIGGR